MAMKATDLQQHGGPQSTKTVDGFSILAEMIFSVVGKDAEREEFRVRMIRDLWETTCILKNYAFQAKEFGDVNSEAYWRNLVKWTENILSGLTDLPVPEKYRKI